MGSCGKIFKITKNMKPTDMQNFFESQAADYDRWHKRNRFYYRALQKWFESVVPGERSVLELGCGDGSLCAALKPSQASGIDFSTAMIEMARQRQPNGQWIKGDLTAGPLIGEPRDYVIGADILGYVGDIQAFLENVRPRLNGRSRLVLTKLNPFWNLPMRVAAWLHLAQPRVYASWLNQTQTVQLLDLAGYDLVRKGKFCLLPINIPLLSGLINRWIAPLPFIRRFCAVEYFIARLKPQAVPTTPPSLSIVIPARNEAGNIRSALTRMPGFPGKLEVIFVEGNSTDNTWDVIQQIAAEQWPFDVRAMKQDGKGKGDAVRKGFAAATGDLLMILDADLTVMPEDLPRFYRVLADRSADYVQGTRLIYPMEDKAMRPLNWLGNKFFSFLFSSLLGQRFSDTLCGTKCLWKKDYDALAANRAFFGDFDPFGDFDLIFGSAKLNFKIKEIPVHYKERIYGSTNINRFRDGVLLLRMSWFAAKKLFFI